MMTEINPAETIKKKTHPNPHQTIRKTNQTSAIDGYVVFVRNIHEEAHEDDVHDIFSDFGNIKNINLNLERRSGLVKGYALIEYAEKDQAQESIEKMNGKEYRDKELSVGWTFVDGPLNDDYTEFSGSSSSSITPVPRGNRNGRPRGNNNRRYSNDHNNRRRKRTPSPPQSRKRERY
ncbi:RNA-binding protein [Acrasis kona]|uniref:RNA-binding protein n=1 Tax=Acrasis kona TaxID=1008807 RepID=A0AAW2ZBJ5_9EUKA